MLDAYVYEVSLDGTDEECGDALTIGWYGLINGPIPYDPATANLTIEEAEELSKAVGAIIHEDTQGFVTVTYYNGSLGYEKSDLAMHWLAITDEINAIEEEANNE
jgi:hypothetical protein